MLHDFERLFTVSRRAAHSAGALLREQWQQPKQITFKGAIDLVTSVDRDCERLIVGLLRQNFPEHAIVAEEETNDVGDSQGYRWIIDPLDGTTNFAHGYPHFCISIALEYASEMILGLVYDPLRRETFEARRGAGATLNGAAIRVSGVKDLDTSLLATGFPYDRREHPDYYLSFFKAFMLRSQGIRRNGSAALDLCYVACGRVEGFWELKLRPWDIAAGALIVAEAGGTLSDFAGDDFSINGNETLASNGLIHDEMLEVLRDIHGRSPARI
jgi:myo-inositol-1(or 4)-monophosphatase